MHGKYTETLNDERLTFWYLSHYDVAYFYNRSLLITQQTDYTKIPVINYWAEVKLLKNVVYFKSIDRLIGV
jgi:hypothetical protein